MPDSAILASLRQAIAVPLAGKRKPARFTLGVPELDARLGGGLLRGAIHEVFADAEDSAATAGFALMLALRALDDAKPILWVREDRGVRNAGALYAPGLIELGADPRDLILVHAPDTLAALRAATDIVAGAVASAVVIEPWGKAAALDLTASRRLALAAERAGVATLVVRTGVDPLPSAAQTRWHVAAAASTALAANAPGAPAFDIELLRHRGGIAGLRARVEWNRDDRLFAPQLPGRALSLPAGRARPPVERRAA